MSLVRSTAALMMVGLLVSTVPGVAPAQEPAETAGEDTGAIITEFAGVEWGAGETTVREKHGDPWRKVTRDTTSSEGSWTMLLYGKKIRDKKALFLFGLRGDTGLTQGLAWIRGFKGDKCETAYDEIVDLVRERHPGLEAETSRHHRGPYLEFCEAVRFDQAARSTRWTDPVNGVVIELTLNDHASMTLHYMTPEYTRLREEKSEGQSAD